MLCWPVATANDMSQYTQEYSLYRKASVALLSSDSGVVNAIIHSLITKKVLFWSVTVLLGTICYFIFISDFSDFVSISE
jgi:hypothetical protein